MHEAVQQYYDSVLESSQDLKTNACSTAAPQAHLADLLRNIHNDITATYYGCGTNLPFDTSSPSNIVENACC